MDRWERQIERIGHILEEADWTYATTNDGFALQTNFRTELRVMPVLIQPQRDGFLVLVQVPMFFVEDDMRDKMVEAIVRANENLYMGSFTMDMADGEVQYRSTVPAVSEDICGEQFALVLDSACSAVAFYDRAFHRLLYGDDLSPAEVVAEAEMAAMVGTPPPDMESFG